MATKIETAIYEVLSVIISQLPAERLFVKCLFRFCKRCLGGIVPLFYAIQINENLNGIFFFKNRSPDFYNQAVLVAVSIFNYHIS